MNEVPSDESLDMFHTTIDYLLRARALRFSRSTGVVCAATPAARSLTAAGWPDAVRGVDRGL